MEFYECLPLVLIANCGSEYNRYLRLQAPVISVDYSSYVKSQNHLDVISGLFVDRKIKEYYNALQYLDGNNSFRGDAVKVLSYFYSDLAKFALNCKTDLCFNVAEPQVDLQVERVNFNDVKNQILNLFRILTPEKEVLGIRAEVLNAVNWHELHRSEFTESKWMEFPYVTIFDNLKFDSVSVEHALDHINNFVVAAIYDYHAKNVKRVILEV